jgi:hypothetical protein
MSFFLAIFFFAGMVLNSNMLIKYYLVETSAGSGSQANCNIPEIDPNEEVQLFSSGNNDPLPDTNVSIAIQSRSFPVSSYFFIIWEPPRVS